MARIDKVVVEGVTRTFGTTVALRGIDATFSSGEVTTLEGHNGSGKSTLLRDPRDLASGDRWPGRLRRRKIS